jgi:hypothetical protein
VITRDSRECLVMYPKAYDPSYAIGACILAIVFVAAFALIFRLICPPVVLLISLPIVSSLATHLAVLTQVKLGVCSSFGFCVDSRPYSLSNRSFFACSFSRESFGFSEASWVVWLSLSFAWSKVMRRGRRLCGRRLCGRRLCNLEAAQTWSEIPRCRYEAFFACV